MSCRLLAAVLGVLGIVMSSRSQPCEPPFLPGHGVPGVNSFVSATTTWDPDGPGPQTKRIVIGGNFSTGGESLARRVAWWDNGRWVQLGSEMNGIDCLASGADGSLYAAGSFAGPSPAIARWNGQSWQPILTGYTNSMRALLVLSNGDLIAAGSDSSNASPPLPYVGRWNGVEWSPMGLSTPSFGIVLSVGGLSNGDVVAAGSFVANNTPGMNNIARWDGERWHPLGDGLPQPAGSILVGESDILVASANTIMRWDGLSWTQATPALDITPSCMVKLPNGDLVAAGRITMAGGVPVNRLARWNGAEWSPLGAGIVGASPADAPAVHSLCALPGGGLLAGGDFARADDRPALNVALWEGGAWSALGSGSGLTGSVWAWESLTDGSLIAAGSIGVADGVRMNSVARWDGSSWASLGGGVSGVTEIGWLVYSVSELPDGGVIAGGDFTRAGSLQARNVARWDGAAWHALGSGADGVVKCTVVHPTAGPIIAGHFRTAGGTVTNAIARWDGSNWQPFGTGLTRNGFRGSGTALKVLSNGDLLVGGDFDTAGGVAANCVARWNPQGWSALGAGTNAFVKTFVELPNGDIVAGGRFTAAGGMPALHVARWDGSEWSPMGEGLVGQDEPHDVDDLCLLPNGDLLAGGGFDGSGHTRAHRLARWTGSRWAPMAGPFQGSGGGRVLALHVHDGLLHVGGVFRGIESRAANNWTRMGCPPCYPNCDVSSGAPLLTPADFQCFLNRFSANDPYANCDGSAATPTLTANDFQCFLNAYAAGCP